MARSKKNRKSAKPTVKVQDLAPQNDPKAGETVRKAGGGQQEYMNVTMSDVFITNVTR